MTTSRSTCSICGGVDGISAALAIRAAPIDAGIFVDLSRGTFVARNDLDAEAAGVADIHLTATTRECRVYEPNDTVRDEGTGNQVIAAP